MPPVIAWVAGVLVAWGVPAAVATWVATLVVNGIIMFAAQKLLVKKPDLGNFMGDVAERQQMVRQSVAPRRLVYGRCKLSGPMLYAQETGLDREYLHIVISLASHECEAIENVYLNDEVLTLDGAGNASGKYAGLVRVLWKLGGPGQTAFTELVTESGGVWNANCKGEDNTLLYVRIKFDAEKFPGGIPNFSVVLKGKKVLDPRTNTTAWSNNAGLCIYDYMRDTKYGLRAPATEFNESVLFATLNNCDEVVNGEPRYTLDGTIDTDQLPEDIISAMLSTMAGRLVWAGGQWHLKSGYWEPAVHTLTEVDMRGPMRVTTRTPRRDLFNAGKGTYVSEVDHWQATDFVPYAPSLYLTQDDGERLWRDYQFPFTLSGVTARRLAKIDVERGRQQIQVSLPCKLTALRVQCGDNVYFTHERMGWNAKLFEVTGFVLVTFKTKEGEDALGVDLTLKETASTIYDWNNGEDVTTDPSPNTQLPDPSLVTNPTGLTLTSNASTAHSQPDGTKVPRLKVAWTAPADQYVKSGGFVEIEYKKSSESTWLQWIAVPGAYTEDFIGDVLAGVNYDVRIRSVNALGIKASTWVQQLNFPVAGDLTAPGVPANLTAVAGTGKAVGLKWDHVTDPDRWEYGVYRHTSNDPGAATKIAEVSANAYTDIDVSTGTTYYYWVSAIDTSENEGAKSLVASATPTALTNAKLVTISASSQIFQVTNTGTPTPSSITFTAAGQNVSGSPSFAVTVGSATLTGSGSTRSLAYADMATDVVSVTVTWDGVSDTVTVAKVREGANGANGSNGTNGTNGADGDPGVVGFLTNEAHIVPADSAGTVTSYANAFTDFKVFLGLVDDTANWSFSATTSNVTGSFSPANRYTVTALSAATGYVDITASKSGYTSIVRRFTLAKSRTAKDAAPSDPSAPTFNSSVAYLSGSGTVLSSITINVPAMPSGAQLLNLLYRRSGGSGWIVADQRSSGGGTLRIDDLTPGVAYESAAQALSSDGTASNVVMATGSPFTAPGIASAPSTVTGITLTRDGVAPKFIPDTNVLDFGCRIYWNAISDKDIAYYEIKAVFTNDSTSTTYTWGGQTIVPPNQNYTILYNSTLTPGFVFVRAVNTSGVAGAWATASGENNCNNLATTGIGTVAKYNSDNVQVTGMKVGSGSLTTQQKAIMFDSLIVTLTGGSATEDINVSLSNRGFSAKPEWGFVQQASDDLTDKIVGYYRYDAAGSTSTNAVVRLRMVDGSNLPSGNVRFNFHFGTD